ncbi:MAG TPA: hydrolase [Thermotoga sp.]|nr:hydrolase [Thermotoga sp.]
MIDERTCFMDIRIFDERIVGKVDTFETLRQLKERYPDYGFSVMVLEEFVPEDMKYGIVVSPTLDVRKDPRFRSERVHQLIFGEEVKILSVGKDYSLVKDLRTGYIGNVKNEGLFFMSENEYVDYGKLRMEKLRGIFGRIRGSSKMVIPFCSHLRRDERGYVLPNGDHFEIEILGNLENDDIVKLSLEFTGVPYLWGGTSNFGFDCSGFVNRLYDFQGKGLPRDTDQLENFTKEVSLDKVEPGDFMFFPGHVGMYIGEGKMIHSSGKYGRIVISSILEPRDDYERFLRKSLRKVGRVL